MNPTRKLALLGSAALGLAAFGLGSVLDLKNASAQTEDVEGPKFSEINDDATIAIRRGLAYLAATQNDDGSWPCNVGFKLNEEYMVTASIADQSRVGGGHVGVTGLAGIAFIAGGHFPGRGMYGKRVERAADYVLSQVKEDGYITDNGSRMYSHAFATLFLAEVYGMTRRSDVREKLQMSIDLIVRSQNPKGSWRYLPFAPDSDMSVTVCQVMALRAAQNTGIRVPKSTIDAAIDYVKKSKIKSGTHKGGFTYQDRPTFQTRTSFSLTAAGIATLNNAAIYSDEDIQEGLNYLMDKLDHMRRYRKHYFYFYGHYYATQAMYIAGSPYWDRYFPEVRNQLLSFQNQDGSWESNVGETFSTAMATVILQIPQRWLPIFQR